MGFNSLQAYYSQHGMGLGSAAQAAQAGNMTSSSAGVAGSPAGTLPPFLPMAAQLSQYQAAASAAAQAAGSAYGQSTPTASGGEYRRPLSVLF